MLVLKIYLGIVAAVSLACGVVAAKELSTEGICISALCFIASMYLVGILFIF